jgi:hypothetical protein
MRRPARRDRSSSAARGSVVSPLVPLVAVVVDVVVDVAIVVVVLAQGYSER